MFIAKSFVLLSGLVAVALAGKTRDGRQFLPADITGDYSQFVKQGTCAKTVNITSVSELSEGAYGVPHSSIMEGGNACTSDGSFTIITKEAIEESGNGFILKTAPLSTVTTRLESQGATYMVGFEKEDRVCGKYTTSTDSVAIFVEEEKKINIPGLITLYPGAKYMIVYEPTSPTPCTYFSKVAERVIGVPNVAEPSEDANPVTSPDDSGDKDIVPAATVEAVVVDGEGDTSTVVPVDGVEASGDSDMDMGSGDGTVVPAVVPVPGSGGDADHDSDHEGHSDDEDHDDMIMEDGLFTTEPEPSAEEEDDDGSVCFPAEASVELEDGSVKRMDQIAIGDNVKVGPNEFSPVFMFTHKTSAADYSFVRLSTDSGAVLSLTKGHYLYVNGQLAAAKTVVVGDSLMTAAGATTVSDVSEVTRTGLYNPQTVQGDIVVDGVLASTYTTTVEMKTAHSLLLPVRAFFGLTGVTTSAFDNGADQLAQIVPSGGIVA